MNTIGKILVILNFLFAVVVGLLIVLNAATRTKLKQKYDTNEPPAPLPVPDVSLEPDEHLGLFSLDDVSLRDDDELAGTCAVRRFERQ